MNKSNEIEEMMRTGKVVKIEPMPGLVAHSEQTFGVSTREKPGSGRDEIANLLIALSDHVLSEEKTPRHIALRIGAPPNSNTITVSKRADRVTFYIRSEDLRKQAEEAQLEFKPVDSEAPKDKYRYRIPGLNLSTIQAHEALFREIVKESVSVIEDRRPMGK
jgi:hypothetical protein